MTPNRRPRVELYETGMLDVGHGNRVYWETRVTRTVCLLWRCAVDVARAAVDLSTNTTDHPIADLELLRSHLGVDRWVVVGWSSGRRWRWRTPADSAIPRPNSMGHEPGGVIGALGVQAFDGFAAFRAHPPDGECDSTAG
jgi:pimeloyl-ACP methyl ester carboxylesterase